MKKTISTETARILGRYRVLTDGIDVSWVNSGIELRFRGTRLALSVRSTSTEKIKQAFLQVWVDGDRMTRIKTALGEDDYVAAYGLEDREHTAKILLVSETQWHPFAFLAAETDGEILPPPEAPAGQLKFDCYGDSLTCGVGTIRGWPGPDSDWQDSTLAHAYRVVEHFGGDGQYTAISGWGVMRGYCGDEPSNVPRVFDCTTMATEEKYDVASRDADYIIVMLGTNDVAKPFERETLRDAYVSFFKKLRAVSPRAKIYCSTTEAAVPALDDAAKLFSETYSVGAVRVDIPKTGHPDYAGSYGHPGGEWGRDVAACYIAAIERQI
ncbi:MAG: hypothetical protein IJU94_06825 [Clostridia bacterium]|nr:hypothetical protein [Clostridia bacterium]